MSVTPSEFVISQELLNNFLTPVQGALGGLAVAEQMQDYFLVFQQAGGTGPEIIDETAFFITYMVDSKGNVAKPIADYSSQYNLLQNFGVGTNVIVRNDASTTLNSQIAGQQEVTAIGRQQPILYTQYGFDTGSHVNEIDWLSKFGIGFDADPITGYFLGAMFAPTQISTNTAGTALSTYLSPTTMTSFANIEAPLPDPTAAVFDASAGSYTFGNSVGLQNLQTLTLQVDARIRNYASFPIQVKVAIQASGYDVAFKWYSLAGVSPPYKGYDSSGLPYTTLNTGNDPLTLLRTSANGTLSPNAEYTVAISRDLGNSTGAATSAAFLTSLTFNAISQTPTPTPPVDDSGTFIGFSTGSSYDDNLDNPSGSLYTWLTASSYVSQGWGNTQDSTPILDLQKSNELGVTYNLSPIEQPFLPRVGDRIRFEYNKLTDYFIYDVITPNLDTQNRLKLKINQVVPPSVVRENYIIHRTNIDDPAYIILNVNKNDMVQDTQNFNGVILPEFPTSELKDNLDRITIDLKERGIITDNEA